jgi:hypothetical protein
MAKALQIAADGWQRLGGDSVSAAGTETGGSRGSCRAWDELKLLIVSTPKTGNTWVKHLLSVVYDLPIVQIPLRTTFSVEGLDGLGERWIAHQHYYPVMSLLRWAEQEYVRFVTTIRHPGDFLMSLYYHVHNQRRHHRNHAGLAARMEHDRHGPGESMAEYVRQEFYYAFNMSIAWMRSGLSVVVRYEDLRYEPATVLANVTAQIVDFSQERIDRAVTRCEIGRMRRRFDPRGRFFRKGAVGGWAQELPERVVRLLRQCEPCPAQLAVLGYDMDSPAPLSTHGSLGNSALQTSPCDGALKADAASVPPSVEGPYVSRKQAIPERWTSGKREPSLNHFLDWLNAPAEEDPYQDEAAPLITNLAAHIHSIRPDIQAIFPDIYRGNRIDYAHWFAMAARDEYQLGATFTLPIISSWLGSREVLQPC